LGAVKSRIVSTWEDFNSLEPLWNELLGESGSDVPFLTHEWLGSYWKHFNGILDPFVLVLEKGSRVVGAVPMAINRVGLLKILRFLGGRHADYQDFILSPDVREEALVFAVDVLNRFDNRWDVVDLRNIREDSPNRALLGEWAFPGVKEPVFKCYDVAPFLSIEGSWQEYTHRLKKKWVKDTERQVRRLERLGDLYDSRAETVGEINECLTVYHGQKGNRNYQDAVATDSLGSHSGKRFLRDFCHRALKNGWLDLRYLAIEGVTEPLAVSISLRYRNRMYYWLPSINNRYLPYSPGRVLLVRLLEESFAVDLAEFDFLNGGEPYKYQWMVRDRVLYRFSLYASGVKGIVWKGWMEDLRPRLRKSSYLTHSVRLARKMIGMGSNP
jgi:CelD/BcsL family acetyltransferase involved in cellulose biosynthesis